MNTEATEADFDRALSKEISQILFFSHVKQNHIQTHMLTLQKQPFKK